LKVAWENKKRKRKRKRKRKKEMINVFEREVKCGRIITGRVKCAVEM